MSRMKLEYTIDDIREVEQDAYERGRRDALEEKTCGDCISRSTALYALAWLTKHKPIGGGEWTIKESDIRATLRNLPSVKPSRPEPEDKQRGRLERFNSAELKKILDNFCEQMACPLPEKTKNEIVANVAREHAMTIAAERLGQAMKESGSNQEPSLSDKYQCLSNRRSQNEQDEIRIYSR